MILDVYAVNKIILDSNKSTIFIFYHFVFVVEGTYRKMDLRGIVYQCKNYMALDNIVTFSFKQYSKNLTPT